jgi:hypothetical protein
VAAAVTTCVDQHFQTIMSLSGARLLVCVADQAAQAVERRYSITLRAGLPLGPITVDGPQRMVLRLSGPGSSGARRIDRVVQPDQLARIRSFCKFQT